MEHTNFVAQSSELLRPLYKRIKVIKAVGGSLMLLTTLGCIVSIVQLSFTPSVQKVTYNCSDTQSSPNSEKNTSICVTVQRYPLTNELYVTVCRRENAIYLKFEKHTKDEYLDITTYQWLFLKRSVAHIDQSIHEAERLRSLSIEQVP